MHKDYFRLSEEIGLNSEFYSDDEEVNRMADELRTEYSNVSSPTLVEARPTPESAPMADDDYDALFNSI
jgi:hypothetical protein